MAREFAEEFYNSKEWKACRKSYTKKVGGLCERCKAKGLIVPGEIVHHKTHLSPDNIRQHDVTLSFNNLQLLCRKCHGEVHSGADPRYTVSENGKVTAI